MRRCPRRVVAPAALCTILALGVALERAGAQERYEIEVYGAQTIAPKSLLFELLSDYTLQGPSRFIEGVAPTYHAAHETVEGTFGLSSWSDVSLYVFTDEQSGLGAKWVGDNVRTQLRIPEAWHWPVGLSVSAEAGYQRPLFSEDTWSWEVRPIVDKYLGRWYVAVNPTVERAWQSMSVRHGVEFSPSAKVGFDFTEKVSAGVEYYNALGESGQPVYSGVDAPVVPYHPGEAVKALATETAETAQYPLVRQPQCFGAVDLHVSPIWEINFGVGAGTGRATDRLVAKLIVGRLLTFGSMGEMQ